MYPQKAPNMGTLATYMDVVTAVYATLAKLQHPWPYQEIPIATALLISGLSMQIGSASAARLTRSQLKTAN